MRIFSAIAIAAIVSGAAPTAIAQSHGQIAQATLGYTYFNRVGATLDQHRRDLEYCFEQALSAPTPGSGPDFLGTLNANNAYYTQTYGVGGAAGGALVLGLMQADMAFQAEKKAARTNIENCMVVLGWRVVQLPTDYGRRLSHLSRSALAAQLQSWVGAESPEGVVARSFENEAITPVSATDVSDRGEPTSLSRLSLPAESLAAEFRNTNGLPEPAGGTRTERAERRTEDQMQRSLPHRVSEERQRLHDLEGGAPSANSPLTASEIAALPSDASLIVVRVVSGRAGSGLAFNRVDADGKVLETLFASPPARSGIAELIFRASPGLWRVAALSGTGDAVSFCMGAPAFEASAGDALFAGTFNIAADTFVPDMTLQSASEIAPPVASRGKEPPATLAQAPTIASRLRPVSYTNGSIAQCTSAPLLYALEFPNAPFVEGYHWASQVSEANTAAAQAPPTEGAPSEATSQR